MLIDEKQLLERGISKIQAKGKQSREASLRGRMGWESKHTMKCWSVPPHISRWLSRFLFTLLGRRQYSQSLRVGSEDGDVRRMEIRSALLRTRTERENRRTAEQVRVRSVQVGDDGQFSVKCNE